MPSVSLAADWKKHPKAKWFNATEPSVSAYICAPLLYTSTWRPVWFMSAVLQWKYTIPDTSKCKLFEQFLSTFHEVKLEPDKSL
jgi:hypothetical protein